MLTEEQKIEIGRMLQEGISDEGIRVVVASWQLSEGTYLQAYQYLQEVYRMKKQRVRPFFHEHEDDHLIPPGYGIYENLDGEFYPYKIVEKRAVYLSDVNGLDIRKETYEQALEHVMEIAD